MPIYEYQAVDQPRACRYCRHGFEILQNMRDRELTACPECGCPVKKIISLCHSTVTEISEEAMRVSKSIRDYEQAGMYSHAAELADKRAEKTKDRSLKTRALENYKKAGYDARTLDRHDKS